MHGGALLGERRQVGEGCGTVGPPLRPGVRRAELAAFGAVVLVVGVLLPVAVRGLPGSDAVQRALNALRITWAMLFVCAGVLRLVRWRLTGETRNAYLGVGLLGFGLVSAPAAVLAPAMFRSETALTLSPVTRAIAVAVCVAVVGRGLRAPEVDPDLRPVRATALLTLTTWAAMLAAARVASAQPLDGSTRDWAVLELLLAAGWAGCAVTAFRRASAAGPTSTWAGINLTTMTVAELLRATAFVHADPAVFFASGLQLVAAAISVANAGADVSEVFSADSARLRSLAGALDETEGRLDEQQRRHDERLHDARSIIAALKAASAALDRYDEQLDEAARHRLRSSMVSELFRLERVIDARAQEPPRPFRLDVALAPLFVAESRNGSVINSQVGAVRVLGRPLEFVTVVQNLIVNARRYAPGSPITVRADPRGDAVTIHVEDQGPGIANNDRERIFERGYRGEFPGNTQGSGLGLYLARRLMREQGGDVTVDNRPGGGARFRLTLPHATTSVPEPTAGISPEVDEPSRPDPAVRHLRSVPAVAPALTFRQVEVG